MKVTECTGDTSVDAQHEVSEFSFLAAHKPSELLFQMIISDKDTQHWVLEMNSEELHTLRDRINRIIAIGIALPVMS